MIILIIVLLLILLGIAAPIQMAANRSKLKEMDRLIEHFSSQNYADEKGKEVAKTLLRKRLIKIKSKILADQRAVAEAADKIAYI